MGWWTWTWWETIVVVLLTSIAISTLAANLEDSIALHKILIKGAALCFLFGLGVYRLVYGDPW